MKNEWWIVIDAEGRSFGVFMGETLAEVSAKNWTEVFPTDGFRVLRVVPADEVEARISAAVAAERERCARVAEESTAYTAFQGVEHYKLASAIAHAIREPKP